jgi:adenosylhomocysteine nucleosidase
VRLGVVAAMPEELAAVLAATAIERVDERGGRTFHLGRLRGHEVVCAVSRIGKVAAAATTALLVDRYGAGAVVLTGLAGAVAPGLRVGDVVVAERLLQHDLDARPLFPRHEIPLLGLAELRCDPGWTARLAGAARHFVTTGVERVDAATRGAFRLDAPRVRLGLVVSGDQFFASGEAIAGLRARLPEALAVEMEGAAMAQVCHELGVPFAVVRTISDAGDDHAARDFARFLAGVCGVYAAGIVGELLA